MIPTHTHSGVLPPFLPGATPAESGSMAPYRVRLLDAAKRFAINNERIEILRGLLAYRKELHLLGITSGFQWIDGSFVEDCEKNRGRPPKDIDVITFSVRPPQCIETDSWKRLLLSRPDLFDPEVSKNTFKCDAYFVDLNVNPIYLVSQVRYWFGLFSHQRDTFLWKGMLEIPLSSDDQDVETFLNQGGTHAA